jgi:mono/diheme cytochrome c family protein
MRALAASGLLFLAIAQTQTTQTGVYTEAQARRGNAVYGQACASCHGPELEGDRQAPPLAGSEFDRDWDGRPLADLFDRIRTTMPGDAPGTLKSGEVADVLAFMLEKGRHPAGSMELPADSELLKAITYAAPKPH